jgi:hypothetical protein
VNTITSRLQSGTTPGNPELVNQWNSAQASSTPSRRAWHAQFAGHPGDDRGVGRGYLLRTCAPPAVGGAVEEDHRNLRSIEGATTSSMQQIDRLIADLNAEIARSNGFLARERTNLPPRGVNLGCLGTPGQQRITVTPRRLGAARTRHAGAARRCSPIAGDGPSLLALVGLILGLAASIGVPAFAQDPSPADRRPSATSSSPRSRPAGDDGAGAFGYASPSIRGMFGTPEIFMDMVRQAISHLSAQGLDFREIVTLHGQVTQKVHVVGPDGTR